MRRKPKRFLDEKLFNAALAHASPLEHAKRAVEKYRKTVEAEPKWDWPKVCLRFSEAAVALAESPQTIVNAVLEACHRFEDKSRGIKGIFDLWFLHDWLLQQVEPTAVGDA